jgi:LCP family protein required for cell wall assembly
VILVLGLGYVTFNQVKGFVANAPFGSGQPSSPQEVDNQPGGIALDGAPQNVAAWSGGRVTILLLGIDERQLEHGPWRTDTMMLLTIDPATNSAAMLSLPRDLWVEIPDYGGQYDRINTANFRGDADQYPGGGGPALAMKTVQYNFGVPVDYFASVNFYAFVQIIDRLGCIPITVPETIDDPDYPAAEGSGYDPFYVEQGDYCMGGETLLKYTRTRATFGSDFDRAARQQQVLLAIRDHILDTGDLPNLIAQSPDIYSDVQAGVNTSLSFEQIIQIGRLASTIPRENICTAVISGEYIEELVTLDDGSQVIIWNREKVRQLVADMFGRTGECDTSQQGTGEDLAAAAKAEGALVSIVNGTQQEGLATETATLLGTSGINVASVGNADRFDYETTVIYDYRGKPQTARYLAQILGLPESAIVTAEPTTSLYDIQIVLGADYLNR